MKWSWRDTRSMGMLTALVGVFFFRLFWPTPQLIFTPDYGRSDAWDFSFSTKYLLAQKLTSHTIPLWTDKIGNGFPIYAEGQTGVFFLPNLILFSLFDVVNAYNAALMFTAVTAATGMYVWMRAMRLSSWVSLFGGVTVGLSGVIIPQLTHIALLQSFTLAPWIMATTYALMHNPSWKKSMLLGILLGQQILTGFPQGVFITICFSLSYVLFFTWQKKKYSKIFYYIVACAIGLGLSAIQIIPSAEFLTNTFDPQGFSLFGATQYAFPLAHLQTFFHPFLPGNPKFGTYIMRQAYSGSIFWENTGYIGLIPIALAAIAFVAKKRWYYVVAATVAFFLMLGQSSPLYILYSFWPFNLFRVPSRFLWILVFCLILYACYGLTLLLQRIQRKSLRFIFFCFLFVIHYISLSSVWWDYHAIVPASTLLAPPEMTNNLKTSDRVYTIGALQTESTIFTKVGWHDIHPYIFLKNTLTANSNVLWGISSHDAYTGRPLRRTTIFDSLLTDQIQTNQLIATISAQGKKLLDIAGVNIIISTTPLDGPWYKNKSIIQKDVTIHRYQNPTALPRAYLVNEFVIAHTAQEAARKIFDPSFVPGKTVLLENSITDQLLPPAGIAHIEETTHERIVIKVTDHPQSSLLVLADTYYPGWIATIDGEETHIYPANISQRAIVVPGGNHTVIFSYHPRTFIIGAWISGVTWLLTLCVMGFPLFALTVQIGLKVLSRVFHLLHNHDR